MPKQKPRKKIGGKSSGKKLEVTISTNYKNNILDDVQEKLQEKKAPLKPRKYHDGAIIPSNLPENYDLAGATAENCNNCIFYYKGNCSKWDEEVRPGYHCDKFMITNTNLARTNFGNLKSDKSRTPTDNRQSWRGDNPYDDMAITADENKSGSRQRRFFDDILEETFKTEHDNIAKFGTTKGGTQTDWVGRQVRVGIELVYKDGSRNVEHLAIANIKNVETSRNKETATIQLEAVTQPLVDASAEGVKDGFDWFQNRPISFLINDLLKAVYKDDEGDLPISKQISGDALEITTHDARPIYWDMGIPNSWDGIRFQDVIDNSNVTAICSGQKSVQDSTEILYIAVASAEYPPEKSEIYMCDPVANLWTLLAQYQEGQTKRVKKLLYNPVDHTLYGYADYDDVNKAKDIWGLDSASNPQTSVKSAFPDIDIIYVDPVNYSGYLNDTLNHTKLKYAFTGKQIIREGMDPHLNKFDFNDKYRTIGNQPCWIATEAINGHGGVNVLVDCSAPNRYGYFSYHFYSTVVTASSGAEHDKMRGKMDWTKTVNPYSFGVNTDWLIKDTSALGNPAQAWYPGQGPQFRGQHKMFTGPNSGHNYTGLYSQIGGWRNINHSLNMGYSAVGGRGVYDPGIGAEHIYFGGMGLGILAGDYVSRQGGENIAVHAMGKQVYIGGMSPNSIRYHRLVSGYDTGFPDFADWDLSTFGGGKSYAGGRVFNNGSGDTLFTRAHQTSKLSNTAGSSQGADGTFGVYQAPMAQWRITDIAPSNQGYPYWEFPANSTMNTGTLAFAPQERHPGEYGVSAFNKQGNRAHIFNLNMIGSDPNDYCGELEGGVKAVHGLYGQIPRHSWGLRADQNIGMDISIYNYKYHIRQGGSSEDSDTTIINETQGDFRKITGAGDTQMFGHAIPDLNSNEYSDPVFHYEYGMAGPYGAYPMVMNSSPWQNADIQYSTGSVYDSIYDQGAVSLSINQDNHRSSGGGVGWLGVELFTPFQENYETDMGGTYSGWKKNTFFNHTPEVEGACYSFADLPTRYQINTIYSNNQQGVFDICLGAGDSGGIILCTADSTYGGYLEHSWVDTDCASGNRMVTGPWRKNSYELGYVIFDCKTKSLVNIANMNGIKNNTAPYSFSSIRAQDCSNEYSSRQPSAMVSGKGADSNKIYLATTTYDSYTLANGTRDYSLIYLNSKQDEVLTVYRNMWGANYHGCYWGQTAGSNTITNQADLTSAFFFNLNDIPDSDQDLYPMRTLMSMGVGGRRQIDVASYNMLEDSHFQNLAMHISIVEDTLSSGISYICAGHTPRSIFDGATDRDDVKFPVSWVWTSTPIENNQTYHVAVTRGLNEDSTRVQYQLYLNGIRQDSAQGYHIYGYEWYTPNPDSAGMLQSGGVECYNKSEFLINSAPTITNNTEDWRALNYGRMVVRDPNHFGPVDEGGGYEWRKERSSWYRKDQGLGGHGRFFGMLNWHWGQYDINDSTGSGSYPEEVFYTGPTSHLADPENPMADEHWMDTIFPPVIDNLHANETIAGRMNSSCHFKGTMWLMGLWNYKLPEIREAGMAEHIETISEMYNGGLGRLTGMKWSMFDTFLPVYGSSLEGYGPQEEDNTREGYLQDSICISFLRYPEPCANNGDMEGQVLRYGTHDPLTGVRMDAINFNGADEFGNPIVDAGLGHYSSNLDWVDKFNGGAGEIDLNNDLLVGWQHLDEMLHLSQYRITAKTEIHEIEFMGIDYTTPNIRTVYESVIPGSQYGGDASVFSSKFGSGMKYFGLINQACHDPSRSILWLNYNSNLHKKIQGWSMRRSNIFTNDYVSSGPTDYYKHCNEVFVYDPDNDENQLTIVDIDMRDGSICDATSFGPFINPETDAGFKGPLGEDRVYYFRQSDPNDGAGNDKYFRSYPIKMSYIEKDASGADVGCYFQDCAATPVTSQSPNSNESFISNQQVAMVRKRSILEEGDVESVWFGTSHWFNPESTISDYIFGIPGFGLSAWKNPSSQRIYQFARSTYDPIIPLADFSNLKVIDAITKLANAYNLMFGLDLEDAFLVRPFSHRNQPDYIIDYTEGEILDMKKSVATDDIRNVVIATPFEQFVEDPKWDIVYDSTAPEEGAFEGDIIIVPGDETVRLGSRTSKSVYICDKSGWMDGSQLVGLNQDFTDTAGDPRPFWKFLTTSSAHDCYLTKPIISTDTLSQQTLYLSSIYKSGGTQVAPGDLVIVSTENDTAAGNLFTAHIENVDPVYSIINVQHTGDTANPFGFNGLDAPVGTNVQISEVMQSTGGSVFEHYNVATQQFSNTGISLITEDAEWREITLTDGEEVEGLVLRVSNPKSFSPAQLFTTMGTEGPTMMVSNYGTDWLRSHFAPVNNDGTIDSESLNEVVKSDSPFGYVYKVDMEQRYVVLRGNPYNMTEFTDSSQFQYIIETWKAGQMVNAWVMFPQDRSKVNLGSPHYKLCWDVSEDNTDTAINTYVAQNTRLTINTFGPKLQANAKRTFTFANAQSILKYGQKEYKMPTNRFVTQFWMPFITKDIIDEYAFPKYDIDITIPYKPNIGFVSNDKFSLNKIRIVDKIMFPSSAGYATEGFLKEYSVNMKTLKMQLKIRSGTVV